MAFLPFLFGTVGRAAGLISLIACIDWCMFAAAPSLYGPRTNIWASVPRGKRFPRKYIRGRESVWIAPRWIRKKTAVYVSQGAPQRAITEESKYLPRPCDEEKKEIWRRPASCLHGIFMVFSSFQEQDLARSFTEFSEYGLLLLQNHRQLFPPGNELAAEKLEHLLR